MVMNEFAYLVIDEIMESDDGSDKRAHVDTHHLVVGLHVLRIHVVGVRYVRQQVQNFLNKFNISQSATSHKKTYKLNEQMRHV